MRFLRCALAGACTLVLGLTLAGNAPAASQDDAFVNADNLVAWGPDDYNRPQPPRDRYGRPLPPPRDRYGRPLPPPRRGHHRPPPRGYYD